MRRWLAARPRIADVLFALALTVAALMLRLSEGVPDDPATAVLVTALLLTQAVPLAWRRTHPWPVMVAVSVTYVVYELVDPMVALRDGLYVMFAAYAVARYARPPASVVAVVVAGVTVVAPDLLRSPLGLPFPAEFRPTLFEMIMIAGLSLAPWLLGVSQRHIHADAARLRDLTARLRAEQEVSARRAVTAERARIARDLHDLVAHHVSAIAMQARATAEVMAEDPHLARRGVTGIGTAADAALVEMRRLLGLLADDAPAGPGDPEPSLRHLDRLATTARAAGCRVEVSTGPGPEVPAAVQVSAYRVVQEALTNVLRHAGATDVRIAVRRAAERLVVTVENGPAAPGHRPLAGSGLGLVGMRERAALFGGSLRAGPRDQDGGWLVEAVFRYGEAG
ncbi:histidine kinase [Streptosporangium sp. NPDC020072]|uniref:sensor histidine kinase n=1 Tax=Streptosporangium sp. NPDC020072 TaxID=3154788 RepID=UPI003415D4B6